MTVCVKMEFDKLTSDVFTEILETFPGVFSLRKWRVKENGGKIVSKIVYIFHHWRFHEHTIF